MNALLPVLLIFLLPLSSLPAQQSRPDPLPPQVQPRREIHPGQPTQLPRAATSRATPRNTGRPAVTTHTQGLSRNITLSFQGSLLGATDLDMSLTGCGPQFSTDFATPSPEGVPPTLVTVNAVVKETVGGLRVEYSLGMRLAIATSSQAGGKTIRNFEFRDMSLVGAVVVKPGEPVVLSKLNDKTLTLTMNEVTKTE